MTQMPMFGQPPDEPEAKPEGDQAVPLRILVTVKAAPNPSDRYGETVCVAGIRIDLEHPGWVRLYPINFRELGPQASFQKYDIITVEGVPARQDPRRESWRPRMPTLRVERQLKGWSSREPWVAPYIESETTMCALHRAARSNAAAQSLALIRPCAVTALKIARHSGWTANQQARIDRYVSQLDLFTDQDRWVVSASKHNTATRSDCARRTR